MNNKALQLIKNLAKDWEYDFRGDLFEDIEVEEYKDFLQTVVNEYMKIWIEDNEENETLYRDYTNRINDILKML